MIFACTCGFVICLLVRLLPTALSKNSGVDQYFFLYYIETYRKERHLPIQLPYLLDKEQSYNPLFPLLLSYFPTQWLERWVRVISPAIEAGHGALLIFALTYFLDPWVSLYSLLIFCITPIAIDYNYQLNPRCLGVLLYSAQMLLVFDYVLGTSAGTLAVVVVLGVLISLLHKMTTQMMWVSFLVLAWWSGRWELAGLPLVIGATSVVASGGFYVSVLKSHFDIVRFWNRHWTVLNAHQYYDLGAPSGTRNRVAPLGIPAADGQFLR
jgi:hypothetical protein